MNKEKRLKIILIVIASLLLIAIGVIVFMGIKLKDSKEEFADNDKKVEQVVDNKVDNKKEQITEWDTLGDKQEYFKLNSDHLKREVSSEEYYQYYYSQEFIDVMFSICNGFFNGATQEDMFKILNGALNKLPDDASAKQVYDKIVETYDRCKDYREIAITGDGTTIVPTINIQAESKYISEKFGYKVGDVIDASSSIDSDKFTYRGNDIWTNSSGIKFKAEEKGASFQFVCIEQPSNQVASNNNSNSNNNNSNSNSNNSNKTNTKIVGRTTPIYLDPNKKYHRDPNNPYCEEAFICEACGGLILDMPGSECLCDIDPDDNTDLGDFNIH